MRYLFFIIAASLFVACSNNSNTPATESNDQVEASDSMDSSDTEVKTTTAPVSTDDSDKLGKKYQTLVDNNILSVEEASAYAQIERNYIKRRKAYQEQGKWDGKTKEAKQTRSQWTKAKNSDLETAIGSDKFQMVQNYFKSNK